MLNHPKLGPWSAPGGFAAQESALDGVTVFAPVHEREQEREKSFRCPQCGATTGFDVAAGGVACEYCGYSVAVQIEHVGRGAEESEFTLDTLAVASEHGWGVDRRELHCDACGAEMAIEAAELAATCTFCASNRVTVREAPAAALRPRFLVPFSLQASEAVAKAKAWLGTGWMHPSDLKNVASVKGFRGIYLPFWTFSATLSCSWEAEVGYQRQVQTYNASSGQYETKTVIDWNWESGSQYLDLRDQLEPGTSRLSGRILRELRDYDLEALVPYEASFLAGWQAQVYDIALPEAWDAGRAHMRDTGRQACRNAIASAHVRNFAMTADFDHERWRYVLLPVYVSAYRFEGRVWQVMVNGQTGTVAGQKPVHWVRIWLAMGALFSPGLLTLLISLPLLFVGVGVVTGVLGVIFLVLGGFFSFKLYQSAVASEAE